MKNFNERVWLNEEGSYSTGSMVTFWGVIPGWPGKKPKKERGGFVAISDCHNTVRIHKRPDEDLVTYVRKVRKMVSALTRYLEFLEDRLAKGKE